MGAYLKNNDIKKLLKEIVRIDDKKEREMGGMEKILLSNFPSIYAKNHSF
jgi:hypothetical protein